jgi:tryptophan-rich sensory protein
MADQAMQMSFATSVSVSVAVCVLAATLEGICAGRNVKSFFAQLQFPPYSAPLWVWSIIGGVYYLIFGFVTYRLLRLGSESALRATALVLILLMMAANAATNYIIFRARNLRASFIVGCLFPLLDISLFACVLRLDTVAAESLVPYLLYRIYAVFWGYQIWKLNCRQRENS